MGSRSRFVRGFLDMRPVPIPALKGRERGNGGGGAWWTGRRASKGWEGDRDKLQLAWDLEQAASRRRTQRALLRVVAALVTKQEPCHTAKRANPLTYFHADIYRGLAI